MTGKAPSAKMAAAECQVQPGSVGLVSPHRGPANAKSSIPGSAPLVYRLAAASATAISAAR